MEVLLYYTYDVIYYILQYFFFHYFFSETTKLHELCRKNKFADLLEELSNSSDDINARDPNGNTPLHEACFVGSLLCVRHLIDEGIKCLTI